MSAPLQIKASGGKDASHYMGGINLGMDKCEKQKHYDPQISPGAYPRGFQ